MRISDHGDDITATRISGPIHHFLGVRFTDALSPQGPPRLVDVATTSLELCTHGARPAPSTVIEDVIQGIREAKERLGMTQAIAEIRYCSSDPYVPGLYTELARSIAEYRAGRNPGTTSEALDEFLQEGAIERFQQLDAFETAA